jgi:flagellar assembly protein FliH
MGQSALTPAGVRALLTQAIAQLNGAAALGVRLHAQDLAALRADPEAAPILARLGSAVRWQPDNTVAMGGCVLDGATGSLDARLDVQMQALRATLLAVREGGADREPGA